MPACRNGALCANLKERFHMSEETPEPKVVAADEAADTKPTKKRATRRKKADAEVTPAAGAVPVADGEAAVEKPKKRTTRRKKADVGAEGAAAEKPSAAEKPAAASEPVAEEKPKRRGRPRKNAVADAEAVAALAPVPSEAPAASDEPAAEKPKRRGRPRKVKAEEAPASGEQLSVEDLNRMTQQATQASSEPTPMPAATIDEAVAVEVSAAAPVDEGDAADDGERPHGRRRRRPGDRARFADDGDRQGEKGDKFNDRGNRNDRGGNDRNNGGRNDRGDRNDRFDRNDRRNKRRNKRDRDVQAEPSLTREQLGEMKVAELRAKAAELGVESAGVHKADLVEAIYAAAALAEGFRAVDGILEIGNDNCGWVRTGNYMEGDNDAYVSPSMVRNLGLRPGDRIEGTVGPNRSSSKYPPLQKVEKVNGGSPEGLKSRARFRDLTPVFPNERLVMECGKDSVTGRAIDLVSPIGKGQRGLIVSPPKAGKTTVLKKICQSIASNNPEVHLFCLLVDERPEEVTDMQRSIKGTVVASTFDMPASNHTKVSELVIEHAKRLVEMGEDVVVVLDSITRLARAYNLAAPASGRILSGGVDSAALYPPKKFLGAARNIENGGSLTIIASALVDTGSKMDEVIFEEFKGTGNMELKLDRELADKRIFPAIDPVSSGTRNEDLLIPADYQPFVWGIRRILANMNNTERAANALVKGLKGTDSNREFLIKSAKKAQQTDYIA